MKRAWQKINRGGLLREYVLFGCLILFSGSLLIVQIIKIADGAVSTADSTRFTVLSVVVFFAIVAWAGFSLYQKSMSYLLWYKEIFDSIPIPLIVTGEDAQWQQINKAMRETMDISGERGFEHLHSRHLINLDGSVKNKIWLHRGEQYQVAGKRLHCGGKAAGYLIFLNSENGISEPVKLQTEMIVKVNRCIKRLSTETGYFRDCASNISNHLLWQSGVITDLFAIIDGLAANGAPNSQALIERMSAIRADMRLHAKANQADLERMQRLVKDLHDVRAADAGFVRQSDSAS